MVKRFAVALPLALLGAAWFHFLALPWPIMLRWKEPERTAMMEYRVTRAAARDEPLGIRHEWIPLERISRNLRRAVIVAEDGRFYEHRGVDWAAIREEVRYRGDASFSWFDRDDLRALLEAIRHYREHRDRIRGRSTITQQLAKNLYFSPERSLLRKADELIVAGRLERYLDKDRILELYLNTAEWGPGIFGAEAAARAYFGRSAADLSMEQAAALAATLPHPLTSNPARRPGRMEWRQRLILARMRGTGPAETVPLEPPPSPEIPAATVELLGTEVQVPLPDSVRPDSVPPDTARPDTIGPPPAPPDTTPPDTAAAGRG